MRKTWRLALAGAPLLSACGYPDYGVCPGPTIVAWDGGLPDGGAWDGGAIDGNHCLALCGANRYSCMPIADGRLECQMFCGGGRAPPGLVALSPMNGTLGSWLGAAAEMEAASVHAFWQLADELEVHGIPGEAARAAAFDEQRHARDTTRLALTHGVLAALPRVRPPVEPRSLDAIALDNAIEGCGRELFSATVNAWQAEHAADPGVRALMRTVAPDELGHARFSHELAEKLRPRLSRAMRRKVREAQEQALLAFAAGETNALLREGLGLMDPEQALTTARRLLG